MDTREARLVDAFAAEPTDGLPVAVLPDGAALTDDQLRAAAGEFATTVAVPTPADGATDRVRAVDPSGEHDRAVTATVATLGWEAESAGREAGTATLRTPAGERTVEVTTDGGVWVEQSRPQAESVDLDYETVGKALGIDPAAMADVGADLPPTRLAGVVDAVAVPVNFLEHLSGAAPDRAALAAVLDEADADAVCAFTFDTLADDAAAHTRTFTTSVGEAWPRTVGVEAPATPEIVGGLVAHLHGCGTVETAITSVEQGHFCDRPGRVHVDASDGLRVGGHTVTTLSGTVTLPDAEDDDIIEA